MPPADTDLVAELTRKTRDIAHTQLAVELQWGTSDYNESLGLWEEELDLCLIVSAPGWDDSRYRVDKLTSLPATHMPERTRARDIASALAAALDLELCAPSLEQAGQVGSRWIERRGPAPLCDYEVQWEAVFWTDDGDKQTTAGVESSPGSSGKDACYRVDRLVQARLGAGARPLMTRTSIPSLAPRSGWGSVPPEYPKAAPSADELRAHKREGRSASRLLRDALERAPALSALSLMIAFEAAFMLDLERLTEISRHRKGEIEDAALDEALEPRIHQQMPRWNRPFALREARARGTGMAAILRADKAAGEGSIYLILSLREAFALDLGTAKGLVDGVDHRPPAELDAELMAAIAARRS
jgi:hypothetical protein